MIGRGRSILLGCAASVLIAVGAAPAASAATAPSMPPSPARITTFPLPPGDITPTSLAQGREGDLWFTESQGEAGHPVSSTKETGAIGRMTPDGKVTDYPLPPPLGRFATEITAGPDGAMWFLGEGAVGRIATDGTFTAQSFPELIRPRSMVVGPDGNLWLTASSPGGADEIARLTMQGTLTVFPLPGKESGLDQIISGPDGNLWFTETYAERVGRITPGGTISEYPVAVQPQAIAVGWAGSVWYAGYTGLGELGMDGGALAESPIKNGGAPLLKGPDERLWFIGTGYADLGRLTIDGRLSRVELPAGGGGRVLDLAPGGSNALWYAAAGNGICNGGGGSCMMEIVKQGTIGRIELAPLEFKLLHNRFSMRANTLRVHVSCFGGVASDLCEGQFVLRRPNGTRLGSGSYAVPTDRAGALAIRLNRRGRSAAHSGRWQRLTVVAKPGPGESTSTTFSVRPQVRHKQQHHAKP